MRELWPVSEQCALSAREWQHCRNVAFLAASDVSSCIKVSPNSITTRDLVNYITGSTGNGTTREVFLSISKRWSVVLTRDRQMKLKKKTHYGIT